MRKNIIWLIAVVVLAVAVVGIWKVVKHKSSKPVSAVLVSPEGTKIKLSPSEAMNSQQLIPVLPGKNVVGPNAAQGAMKTVNDVQEINRINKENAK
jgi:predicted negative regulator of RcsB-dependent stress response